MESNTNQNVTGSGATEVAGAAGATNQGAVAGQSVPTTSSTTNVAGQSAPATGGQSLVSELEKELETTPAVDAGPEPEPAPVKGKKKSGSGLIFAMVFVILLAAGGIGFGVWAMMDGNQQKEQLNSQISTLKTQNNELQKQIEDSVDNCATKEVETNSNDAWSSFVSGLTGRIIQISADYDPNNNYNAYALKDEKGHLVIRDSIPGENEKVILELDNVLIVYYVEIGNGGMPYYYIVGTDGSVSRILLLEDHGRQLEKLEGYNRIVTVSVTDGLKALMVDIDGNTYESY